MPSAPRIICACESVFVMGGRLVLFVAVGLAALGGSISSESDQFVWPTARSRNEAIVERDRRRDHAAPGAVPDLRQLSEFWQQVHAPYEAAKARVVLAEAYRAHRDICQRRG